MGGTTVVVGGAQGIGAAVARRLATEPWTERLVIADIRADLVAELAGTLRGEGIDAAGTHVDVSDAGSIASL